VFDEPAQTEVYATPIHDSRFTIPEPMNKRAKKRLKETIAKDKQERTKALPQQRPGSAKDPQQLRGFLPKPEKKRG
jgi:hypothetical protein